MPAKHLTYFKVENFKKFESLELQNIGQFNLVTGDNNVGKTSLLEALTFKTDRRGCMAAFHKTLMNRGINLLPKFNINDAGEKVNLEYPKESLYDFIAHNSKMPLVININYQNDKSELIIIKYLPEAMLETLQSVVTTNKNQKLITEFNDGRFIEFQSGGVRTNHVNPIAYETVGVFEHVFQSGFNHVEIPFINTVGESPQDFMDHFFESIGQSRQAKKKLVETINEVFFSHLEDIELRKVNEKDTLSFAFKNIDEVQPVNGFGDGVLRFMNILVELQRYKGTRLMIDEIDTGVHHSRMKGFLKAVIKAAEINEVQLFMTTHSLECQQKFVEVFEDADMAHLKAEVRNYTMLENKEGKVMAIAYDFEQLRYGLESKFETRGEKRGW
jgi:AAA15 family ATPase/GTPase